MEYRGEFGSTRLFWVPFRAILTDLIGLVSIIH
jgi:hypothetical protein